MVKENMMVNNQSVYSNNAPFSVPSPNGIHGFHTMQTVDTQNTENMYNAPNHCPSIYSNEEPVIIMNNIDENDVPQITNGTLFDTDSNGIFYEPSPGMTMHYG